MATRLYAKWRRKLEGLQREVKVLSNADKDMKGGYTKRIELRMYKEIDNAVGDKYWWAAIKIKFAIKEMSLGKYQSAIEALELGS